MDNTVEGSGRPARGQAPGNRKRFRAGDPIPALQFGQHGELTPKTIKQANLTPAEEARAYEMLHVQAAYLNILDCLSYPVDPDGSVHDLSAIQPTRLAIAWTLALCGFRQTGQQYIKKRGFDAPGCYRDAHTWVDARAPDTAEEQLQPQHRADDPNLPPDVRGLAARRDGVSPEPGPDLWHTPPNITYEDVPRESP
jgi:hypothetical protein